jgi:hypothetical protein
MLLCLVCCATVWLTIRLSWNVYVAIQRVRNALAV